VADQVIYRECTQRTICRLYGRQLIDKNWRSIAAQPSHDPLESATVMYISGPWDLMKFFSGGKPNIRQMEVETCGRKNVEQQTGGSGNSIRSDDKREHKEHEAATAAAAAASAAAAGCVKLHFVRIPYVVNSALRRCISRGERAAWWVSVQCVITYVVVCSTSLTALTSRAVTIRPDSNRGWGVRAVSSMTGSANRWSKIKRLTRPS